MSVIASIDLARAIVAHWDDSGLEWEFKKNWSEADRDEYVALNDTNATDQPFPYCVYQIDPSAISERSSGNASDVGAGKKRSYRTLICTFQIYARQLSSNSTTAKQNAAHLAELVVSKFGGHSNGNYPQLDLDNASLIQAQYVSDGGLDLGDEEYSLSLIYEYLLDVSVVE